MLAGTFPSIQHFSLSENRVRRRFSARVRRAAHNTMAAGFASSRNRLALRVLGPTKDAEAPQSAIRESARAPRFLWVIPARLGRCAKIWVAAPMMPIVKSTFRSTQNSEYVAPAWRWGRHASAIRSQPHVQ